MSGHLDGPPPGPPDPPYIPGDLGAPSAEEFARRRASPTPEERNPYAPSADWKPGQDTFTSQAAGIWAEGFAAGRAAADSWWRSRLVSDETVEAVAMAVRGACPVGLDDDAETVIASAVLASLLPVNEPEPVPTQRITHGRHCTCTPCRVEDWTNPALAPCGMHGRDCPREYAPLGGAGQVVPVNEPETATPIPDSEFVEPPLMPSDPISERMIDVADDAFRSGSSDEQAWRECLGDALYAVYPLIREQVMAEASQGKRPVSAGSDGEDRPANPEPETDT